MLSDTLMHRLLLRLRVLLQNVPQAAATSAAADGFAWLATKLATPATLHLQNSHYVGTYGKYFN